MDSNSSEVKVGFEFVCSPKAEGGLGLERVMDWNKVQRQSTSGIYFLMQAHCG